MISFQKSVARYSSIWRLSESRSGFDEAIYWIELLIKLGNFDHLKINDGDLSLIQYFCVDVILFFIFITTFLLYLSLKMYFFTREVMQRKIKLKVE